MLHKETFTPCCFDATWDTTSAYEKYYAESIILTMCQGWKISSLLELNMSCLVEEKCHPSLGMGSANERWCYNVTSSLTGWAHTHPNDIRLSWTKQPLWLTHWGRVTHICVNESTSIGSDNGLSPGRRQAIIWTNDGILLIGPLGTNFSEIVIEIQASSLRKMRLKMSSAKRQPFCLGLNVLMSNQLQKQLMWRCHWWHVAWLCPPCSCHAPQICRTNVWPVTPLWHQTPLLTAISNSLWPGDAIWCQRCWSTLIQVMVCHLTGDKPSPEPMLPYC